MLLGPTPVLPALARCSVLKYALRVPLSPTPPPGELGFLDNLIFIPFHPKGGGRGKAKQSSREDEDDEDEGPVVSEGVRRESMEKGNGGNQEGTPPTERTKDDEKK